MTGVLIREVQIRKDEFIRQLPDAIGDFSYSVEGDEILLRDGDKRVDIKLVYQGDERVGPMELPVQQVHFVFENMSDIEARSFMERWDNHKMRMGGG
ncbi:MAG: hypothetical protein KJ587_05745 [Alphaproteobacteria bacterium]|nr:hypothetical protein [Alphaproteobacteria bacterium]